MSATPRFTPLETPYGWMVSVPASMSGTNKRRKKYFADETAAKKFAAKLRGAWASGVRNAVLPANVAIQAAEAMKILDGTGIGLVEAARLAKAKIDDQGSETFRDRMTRCIAANEAHWSQRYTDDMGKIRRWVPEWFLKMRCGGISPETIRRALLEGKALSQSTIETRTRYVSAVLGYKERHRKVTEIRILTKQECRALLRACENREEIRAVALLLFAGIRPDAEAGEIRRLNWRDVGESEIYVHGDVAKTGTDRHIPILPRLKRLLRDHPREGAVTPANWRRVWKRLRASAGIADTQDACRHTFASMLLAWHQGNEGPVKMAMGHTAGSSTLFRHYRRAVTHEDGLKFFR